jgi:hypothetical protein
MHLNRWRVGSAGESGDESETGYGREKKRVKVQHNT